MAETPNNCTLYDPHNRDKKKSFIREITRYIQPPMSDALQCDLFSNEVSSIELLAEPKAEQNHSKPNTAGQRPCSTATATSASVVY